ncbi:MAG TPA: hypothetical protein ENK91_00070 [Bacteroidetes bacterium]|nr:hypothetical protein [Arcobacter sp.]HHH52029.1 hypothetical protein [Bacteroidota bacterium]
MNIDNFLVVGLVRNCEINIFRSIDNISKSLQPFKNVKYLIIESDSNDNTIESLKKLSLKIKNFNYISLGELRPQHPLRTDRIAVCRNKYLDEINTNNLYSDIDYVIMADLDDVNTLLTSKAIISCWEQNHWDICTANQKYAYYDIYALRHDIWQPNDCLKQYDFLRQYGLSKEKAQLSAIYSKMVHIQEESEWIEVDSAFGGLAIYKKEILQNIEYTGLDNNGEEICEHVPFHTKLKKRGYKIYINPKLINGSRWRDSLNKYLTVLFINRIANNFFIRPIKNLFKRIK